jgi:hypothetical protein
MKYIIYFPGPQVCVEVHFVSSISVVLLAPVVIIHGSPSNIGMERILVSNSKNAHISKFHDK